MHKELMAEENRDFLGEYPRFGKRSFMEADKGMAMVEDGKNYGEFLLDTIKAAKDQFTASERRLLRGEAKKIRDIESALTMLEEKYPEVAEMSMDSDMSMPAGDDMSMVPDDGSMEKFPAFEGKDLDGNPVKSDELFSANAVTVVNFWFTTCNPCVGELAELDALNKELAQKGGCAHRRQHLHAGRQTKRQFPKQKMYWPRRARPIRMCIFLPTARRKVHYKHFCLPHHLCG